MKIRCYHAPHHTETVGSDQCAEDEGARSFYPNILLRRLDDLHLVIEQLLIHFFAEQLLLAPVGQPAVDEAGQDFKSRPAPPAMFSKAPIYKLGSSVFRVGFFNRIFND